MQHFPKPKNLGKMKDADGIGKVGNPICGDVMWVYTKVGKRKKKNEEEYIKDIKFQTLGCAAASHILLIYITKPGRTSAFPFLA